MRTARAYPDRVFPLPIPLDARPPDLDACLAKAGDCLGVILGFRCLLHGALRLLRPEHLSGDRDRLGTPDEIAPNLLDRDAVPEVVVEFMPIMSSLSQ